MLEIDWNKNPEQTRIVCMLFAKQVGKGNRPNTYLNALGYDEVAKGFKLQTGLDMTKMQLKNKWDKLKEDFKARRKLLGRQTGIGWNQEKGPNDMDEEWWKKARNEILGCGKFKKQSLQNEEELATCFADITSIGIDHWYPCVANVVAPTQNVVVPTHNGDSQEGADEVPAETQGEKVDKIPMETPPSGKRPARIVQDKVKKPKTGNALLIQEASHKLAIERSFGLLKMKWAILYKMPGYSILTQEKIVAATMILHNFIREHVTQFHT